MNDSRAYILDDRAQALAQYPHARREGEWVFVSGISSRRADNTFVGARKLEDGSWEHDIAAQTEAVLENIRAILQQTGLDLADVVDVTTFLINMVHYPGYNAVYNRYFEAHSGPTRTTVAVFELPHPAICIEIKAIARVRPGEGATEK